MEASSPVDPATGQATGKTQFGQLTITKAFGASDPQFLQALAAHEVLKTVEIDFVTSSGSPWQKVVLTNALAVDMQRQTLELDDAKKTSMLADTIAMTYQKLELTDASGTSTVVDQ
jgi:type VI secretion system Hcp family effector